MTMIAITSTAILKPVADANMVVAVVVVVVVVDGCFVEPIGLLGICSSLMFWWL